jgi:hypothetical protein
MQQEEQKREGDLSGDDILLYSVSDGHYMNLSKR